MHPQQLSLIHFSATGTTAKIVTAIGLGTGITPTNTHNLLQLPAEPIVIPRHHLAIIGVPVFSGRVPETARQRLAQVRGEQTPAILVCVYGNRAFDDALLELREIALENGFVPLSAAAFVAQHSIFPQVGAGRPDAGDLSAARQFGQQSLDAASATTIGELHPQGNTPYRPYKRVPLIPYTSKRCNSCGACAKGCPTQAIDPAHARRTDKRLCIACAHCIAICPQHARRFDGLLYSLIARKFAKANAARCEPYTLLATGE